MKNFILILGLILLLGGLGLAIYGMNLPYQYSYKAIIVDKMQNYTTYLLQTGNSTSWSQDVSSERWMEININSYNREPNGGPNGGPVPVEMTVTGSISGKLYDTTGYSFYDIISFIKTETISIRIFNPSDFYNASISGTFTFEQWGIQFTTRHQMEPLYLLYGGVIFCSGLVLAIYGFKSNKTKKLSLVLQK